MSSGSRADRESFAGAKEIDRMMRVSPLTIGAVYKKQDCVGQGFVLNLSRGGVFLSTKDLFELGDTFRIRFFLPFQLGQVDAEVGVRWRTQDAESPPKNLRGGQGLEFVKVAPEALEKIEQFIDRFVELADKLESP